MVLILIEILFFIFLLPFGNVYAYNPITCVAGTSYVEQASNVTCYFHKDIAANKTAISVVMVPTTNKKDKEERDVIQCSWAKLATKPECLVSEGYTFNYEVTDRLTVEIPSTTANFAGVYSCHIVPPNGATFETCELIVNEKNTEVSGTSSVQPPQEGVASAVPEWPTGIMTAILTVLVILTLLVLGLCSYMCAWKNEWQLSRLCFRGHQQETEVGDTELGPENEQILET
ncbi:uncharacterized protein [Littorina saxatilis]|uniref:uncharacterized protein isoform X1 n=1 Tax=Littorina saxatilis TaxID=31220 RepID=UPI0038B64324